MTGESAIRVSLLRRLARRATSRGLRGAVGRLWGEVATMARDRAGRIRARRLRGRLGLRLHLGCGGNHKAGWVNVDMGRAADFFLDLREPFPFADGCCAMVYSEHFLEHLDYPEEARLFVRECHRVLAPGGRMDVGVPDGQWPLLEYAGVSDRGFFDAARERWHPAWAQTRMEHVNCHFRQGGEHRFTYDAETLEGLLRSCGFSEVWRREFDASLDSAARRLGTLYFSARRV